MINATDKLLFLQNGRELHHAIQLAISTAVGMLEVQHKKRASLENIQQFGFYRLLDSRNHRPGVKFDEAFLWACFEVSQDESRNTTSRAARRAMTSYLVEDNLPGHGLAALKRGLKLMLIELWRTSTLLLPTTFTVGSHFNIGRFEHRLLSWLKSIDSKGLTEPGGNTVDRRLFYYGPRLLWTTDWQAPADISLQELATLHHALRQYMNQQSSVVIAGDNQIPFTHFAARALQDFPKEVRYSADDLATYSRWSLSAQHKRTTFEEFLKLPPSIAEPQKPPGGRKARAAPSFVEPSSGDNAHEVLQANFCNLQKMHRHGADWLINDLPSYAGREHVALQDVVPLWVQAMRAFMHHRERVQEYRSSNQARAALNYLADYLFFYLPWWRELAQFPKVDLPRSPRELSRFAFISRHTSESLDELPETLMTVIGWRRKSRESFATVVHMLNLFFSFVETHFAEDENMAGSGFRSPLNPEFDAPRISKRSKTTKEVIPKNIYSYLLFYAYAVEEVGMQLEQLSVAGKLPLTPGELRDAPFLKLADFGISVSVNYRSSKLPLAEVPNVFLWWARELRATSGESTKIVYVPHCTTLRLLLTSVETGLRCQSVQWLDRHTWRRQASSVPADSYTFPLHVNTDKTKTEPWTTLAVYRVRELLQRQEDFQSQFADADAFNAVAYEGTTNSPFDDIEPLFRSPNRGIPISDSLYFRVWQQLMVGFEAFFRAVTGEDHVQLYKLQPVLTADGAPKVGQTKGTQTSLFCPMSLLAVHTPHACRATFTTNRKGILELSDTAELLGHRNVVTTAHYDKPSIEDLAARLKASDLEQSRDFLQFEAESDVHIRADKPDSVLMRSFAKDRNATLKAFGFVPGVTLWSMEDAATDDGLRLLREGPMSRIRFRETHICPVGEECPADILERIGGLRRCGCCPLAARCVDHLPAIAAKRNQLLERIRFLRGRYAELQAQGEPVSVLDEIWDEMELDANEYLGLQFSEEVLSKISATAHSDDELSTLHVEQPEMVRRHLSRVSRAGNTADLMLQRIADSNAYPSMTTPQVQMAAQQIKRRLLAGRGHDSIEWDGSSESAVKEVAMMLAVVMKNSGLSREETAQALSSPATANVARLLTGDRDGN